MTTIALTAELAAKYNVDSATAGTAVDSYVDQIKEDEVFYDADTGHLTDAGAEVVREQFADDYADPTSAAASR